MVRSLVILAAGIIIGAAVALSFTTEQGAARRRRVLERLRERRSPGSGYRPGEERTLEDLPAGVAI